MSLQSDAETVADLCDKIIRFEVLRAQLQGGGGTVQVVPGMVESAVPLSGQQKQTLLAQQDSWKTAVKSIVAGW